MKRHFFGPALTIALLANSQVSLGENATKRNSNPNVTAKSICAKTEWICITPMVYTKSNISVEHGKIETDLVASSLGATFSRPDTNFFVELKGSIMPYLKYDSVHEHYEETVGEKIDMSLEAKDAKIAQAYTDAKAQIAAKLAAAGLVPGSPAYIAMFNQYYGVASGQIAAADKKYTSAIEAKKNHALEQGDYRLKEIQKQDSIQEVVVGYQDETFIFRVGKLKGGTAFDGNGASEMGKYVATKPVTDELKTLGQARGNIELGKRNINLGNDIKITLVAVGGKEGRVFRSAVQDTSNALRMSDEDFKQDEKLIGFDTAGGILKFDFENTGHSLTVIGYAGPKGPTVGTELRIQILPELIAHVAYMYANKFGAKGHQARGQIDYHIGEKFGAEWVVALYGQHSQIQDYSVLPIEVDSESGLVKQNEFGAALTASQKDLGGFNGVSGNVTLDLGYKTSGDVGDGKNFLTQKPMQSDVVEGGFVGTFGFSLNY